MGGLGNQMFQYALYRANKKKIKNLYVDVSFFTRVKCHNGYELNKIFSLNPRKNNINILKNIVSSQTLIYKQLRKLLYKTSFLFSTDELGYIENILNKAYVIFKGSWESEKYFIEIQDEIRKDFVFPAFKNYKNIELKNILKITNSISIHVRRGDYLCNRFFGGLTSLEYYKKCILYIQEKVQNPKFIIFSNDICWCKNNLELEKDSIFVDWNIKEESFRDMQLMSLCKHNIIANSSFSWWGAWLNDNSNKIVLAPQRWFNKECNFYYDDIIPETWIKIDDKNNK